MPVNRHRILQKSAFVLMRSLYHESAMFTITILFLFYLDLKRCLFAVIGLYCNHRRSSLFRCHLTIRRDVCYGPLIRYISECLARRAFWQSCFYFVFLSNLQHFIPGIQCNLLRFLFHGYFYYRLFSIGSTDCDLTSSSFFSCNLSILAHGHITIGGFIGKFPVRSISWIDSCL